MQDCAAHYGDRSHAFSKRWIEAEGEPKVGERSYGNDRDLAWCFSGDAQHLFNGALARWRTTRGRVADISEPIGPMHPFGGGEGLRHWASRADRNRHVIEAAEFEEAQRVRRREVRGDIAVDAPYGDELCIGATRQEEHGNGVINTNICIEEDLSAFHESAMIDPAQARRIVLLHC